jgi:3-hydroxybutyryl-CoA dehydratase
MRYEINDMYVGQTAQFTKTISESDVYLFAGITGAQNPMQVNDVYAKQTRYGERIVHGMLSSSLISTVIGTQLPGNGTIYVQQKIEFKAPVFFGDTISAIVEVTDIYLEKNRVKLRTYCKNQNGEVVLDGFASVIPPRPTKL